MISTQLQNFVLCPLQTNTTIPRKKHTFDIIYQMDALSILMAMEQMGKFKQQQSKEMA